MIKYTLIGAVVGLLYEIISINLFALPMNVLAVVTPVLSVLTTPGWAFNYLIWDETLHISDSSTDFVSYLIFTALGAFIGFVIYKIKVRIKKTK